MRTKPVEFISFGMLCLVTLAASGAEKTVTDKERGFEITFPEAWIVEQPTNIRTVSAKAADAKVKLGIDTQELKDGMTLKDFVDFKFADKDKDSVKIVETKLAGVDARKVTITFGGFLVVENYCIVANRRSYCIFFEMMKSDSDKYAKDIDAIVKSFKLIEAK